ncbi:MAG: 2,3-bisphosphoglycerate-independent phosphoglycerate mutase [Planctomycetota bacterium]
MGAPPKELLRDAGGKIVLLVIDGLSGLPDPKTGRTEMETARLPQLDALAQRSSVGRMQLLPPGLTPGSGPGHLALFGYNPMEIDFGRGVLEALGSDYALKPGEIAARGNFCTLDQNGIVRDRRAGRPSDTDCRRLCETIARNVRVAGAKFSILPGKEHRFTLVLAGDRLGHRLSDNDPQVEGKSTPPFRGFDASGERTAQLVTKFAEEVRTALRGEVAANGVLLRGFSSLPPIEPYAERYRLRAAAIAIYPMYRGVARLVGMDVLAPGKDLAAQIASAKAAWQQYDFFFLHTKDADTAGHSGEFARKVEALEMVDRHIPALLELGAEVVLITGDHSTPCVHREHSWHPVPVIIASQRALPIAGTSFSERGVIGGELGCFAAEHMIQLALAHADRLDKFGA